jgi:hypothetical protein
MRHRVLGSKLSAAQQSHVTQAKQGVVMKLFVAFFTFGAIVSSHTQACMTCSALPSTGFRRDWLSRCRAIR